MMTKVSENLTDPCQFLKRIVNKEVYNPVNTEILLPHPSVWQEIGEVFVPYYLTLACLLFTLYTLHNNVLFVCTVNCIVYSTCVSGQVSASVFIHTEPVNTAECRAGKFGPYVHNKYLYHKTAME